jgi:ATP citrate (pro-S)-lyase
MSQKSISEWDGKSILTNYLHDYGNKNVKLNLEFVKITKDSNLKELVEANPWLLKKKLVAKPDQLIKRRGKLGLVCLNKDWDEIIEWINSNMDKGIFNYQIK